MIIETNEYRDLLKTELEIFKLADAVALNNKRYSVKTAVLVVQTVPKLQIVCGTFCSFRTSTYDKESGFHPEYTALDMYSADISDITFYISKLNIKNEPLPSRPCKRCMLALQETPEVTHIVYRDDKLRIVKEALE